jgi:hypothetical protein
MNLNFKEWLAQIEEEAMTSTGSIANVPMRLGAAPGWMPEDDEPKKKHKKHHKKHHKKDDE